MKVYIDGAENIRWAIDSNRSNLRAALKRLDIDETDSLLRADVVHNVMWDQLFGNRRCRRVWRALSALRNAWTRGHWHARFGLASAFNDDIAQAGIETEAQKFDTIFRRHGSWVQHALFASQQGLMLLHLENARSGLIWQLLARNLNIQRAFDRLAAPPQISLEAEAGEGDGRIVQRSQAHGVATVQLMTKESRTMSFEITSPASYLLKVRYSNDSYGPPEKIDVIIDGEVIDMFKAFDTSQYVGTGSYGSGWNVFVSNEAMGPIDLQPGVHTVTLTVRSGDAHGVEIDSVQLEKSEPAAAAETAQ